MKKLGFTLAEVLITLGIIGVVSALTMPTLVQNVGTSKIGPSLAKAVSSFEIANENMLSKTDAATILASGATSGSGTAEENYINALSNFMKVEQYNNSDNSYTATDYQGNSLPSRTKEEPINNAGNNNMVGNRGDNFNFNRLVDTPGQISPINAIRNIAISKDGMFYLIDIDERFYQDHLAIRPFGGGGGIANPDLPAHRFGYGTVLIDINGSASPNKLGKDIFAFQLNADGSLTAWGSNRGWDLGDDKCNATTVGTGITCGASILENNRKVIY